MNKDNFCKHCIYILRVSLRFFPQKVWAQLSASTGVTLEDEEVIFYHARGQLGAGRLHKSVTVTSELRKRRMGLLGSLRTCSALCRAAGGSPSSPMRGKAGPCAVAPHFTGTHFFFLVLLLFFCLPGAGFATAALQKEGFVLSPLGCQNPDQFTLLWRFEEDLVWNRGKMVNFSFPVCPGAMHSVCFAH